MAISERSVRDKGTDGPITPLTVDPPTDIDGTPLPTLISGTSTEFLGNKPLPRAVQSRSVVFVLGPRGVGKTTVAARLAGAERMHLTEAALQDALRLHARSRTWPDELQHCPSLVLEGLCFLARRPAVIRALSELLGRRVGAGKRTWICEPEDGYTLGALMADLGPKDKATIVLRFPVGRGRRRAALRMCEDLGLDRAAARVGAAVEPWTYAGARAALEAINTRS